MLRELRIRNIAIVESLDVTFKEGLNAVTGETGAGKSLIVNAIELILGGRASADQIRAGAEEAWIEALFEVEDAPLPQTITPTPDGVVLKRVISRSGKNRAYINDSLVTLQGLAAFGRETVDLHGQHEHQSLLSASVQRRLLDSFGGLTGLAEEVGGLYSRYQGLRERIREIRERSRERAQRIDLLRYQIGEIEAAGLRRGEKEELLREREILSNLSHLRHLTGSAFALLKEEEGSVTEKLGELRKLISELNRIDGSAGELQGVLNEADALLQDAAHTLRSLAESYDSDPGRLDEVLSRLSLIETLERKYADDVEGILRYREEAASELEELETLQEGAGGIEAELGEVERELKERVRTLSRERRKTAARIEALMKEVLTELAFSRPEFRVEVSEAPLSSTGVDRVEFLFSANPGQPPRPLRKVASGGELSRVMLALKGIFADVDEVPVLVFDEVDAGVGGRTAESVGRRLQGLSGRHQVICITHLPQIASRAAHHILVAKEEMPDGVAVQVKALDREERVREVARMLSGSVTESSLRHAEELLRGS